MEGRRRVRIERVSPEIDCGRYPVKRVIGEDVAVQADVYADGHEAVRAVLRHKRDGETAWAETEMVPLGNDRFEASFPVTELGRYRYTVVGWIDAAAGWLRDIRTKVEVGAHEPVDLLVGAELARDAAKRARGKRRGTLQAWATRLEEEQDGRSALDPELSSLLLAYPDRREATDHPKELGVIVDPPKARFSSWYELFPRSASTEPGRHGTFDDVIARLPYVERLGFDVLYLPPIHPIGTSFRKGRNNTVKAEPGDVGSPWAIGDEDGGHKAIHPELGTVEDLDRLVAAAADHGIELALDIAFQCSPDHPWVKEHPEWFRHRPDGTIAYAENPPKRYQDIYPLDFASDDWEALWRELRSVFEHWIGHGIKIFRVDNPHTKALPFWEWCIDELKAEHPEAIFLSEAFTRPRLMYGLAKLGFTQSYTYFTWRTSKWELQDYLTEVSSTEVAEYFRPNLWPNTPDILPGNLQRGERSTFTARLILAATLGANYGIYGPAFELMEHQPLQEGKEEYLHSEKYEIRSWDWDDPGSLADLIALVNGIRREQAALHHQRTLRFHPTNNEHVLAYTKQTPARDETVLVIVNLDPHHTQSATVDLQLHELGLDPDQPYEVHDLLTNVRYRWHGYMNYVELDPWSVPAHVFRIAPHVRTERDFDGFA